MFFRNRNTGRISASYGARLLSTARSIALLCAFLSGPTSAAVLNGSFEDPVGSTFGVAPFAPTDWGASFGDNGTATAADGFGLPQAGDQYLFLPYFPGTPTADLYQTVPGHVVGQVYQLQFHASAWSDATVNFGPSIVTAEIAGQTLVTNFDLPQQDIDVGTAESPWILRTLTFVATATSELLTFTSTRAGPTGSFPALDNVSIVPLAVSVDPSTWSRIKSLYH